MNLNRIFQRTSTVIWISGALFLLLGTSGQIHFKDYEVVIAELWGRVILIAVGIVFVGLSVFQLRNELGEPNIEVLDMHQQFPAQLETRVQKAKRFIFDTNLSEETPRQGVNPQESYRRLRDLRVTKGEIGFKRVEIIMHRDRLASVIRKLLLFEGRDFYLRHYEAPPRSIPLLHLMVFDDEHFYLGGFYPPDTPPGEEKVVHIQGGAMAKLLKEYAQVLWLHAKPLNPGGKIDWEELTRIGKNLGMTTEEFKEMVRKIKEEVRKS